MSEVSSVRETGRVKKPLVSCRCPVAVPRASLFGQSMALESSQRGVDDPQGDFRRAQLGATAEHFLALQVIR